MKTGVAGLSIEDFTLDATKPLFDFELAVARIKAARAAIDADQSGVLLTGRCEAFLWGVKDLNLVIDRFTPMPPPAPIASMRRASRPRRKSQLW